jgi:hypothetical protein
LLIVAAILLISITLSVFAAWREKEINHGSRNAGRMDTDA